MKNVAMLLSLLFLVSCSRTYVEHVSVECSKDNAAFVRTHSSFLDGAKDFFAKYIQYMYVQTDMAGKDIGDPIVDSTHLVEECKAKSCKDGYIKYDGTIGFACIPKPDMCKQIGFVNKTFDFSLPLSSQYTIINSEDPSCNEEPFSCGIGYSINASDPENLSCSQTNIFCSGEELAGLNASSGTKTFNTETNSYDSCQIEGCIEGATQVGNSCTVSNQAILGCMDERAENYNAQATMSDMSCHCGIGQEVYSTVLGCPVQSAPL